MFELLFLIRMLFYQHLAGSLANADLTSSSPSARNNYQPFPDEDELELPSFPHQSSTRGLFIKAPVKGPRTISKQWRTCKCRWRLSR